MDVETCHTSNIDGRRACAMHNVELALLLGRRWGKHLCWGRAMVFHTRAFVIASLVIAGSATCQPVLAPFWGDRPSGGGGNNRSGGWGDNRPGAWGSDDGRHRRRERPGRDFFPFFGERYER